MMRRPVLMSLTDNDKIRLDKLLSDLDVVELKIPERCREIVNEIYKSYSESVTEEWDETEFPPISEKNPFKIDPEALREWRDKGSAFGIKGKKSAEKLNQKLENEEKKPWHTNSSKEKLSRINHEIKRHHDKGYTLTETPSAEEIKHLVEESKTDDDVEKIRVEKEMIESSIKEAKKDMPNIKFRKSSRVTFMDEQEEKRKKEDE